MSEYRWWLLLKMIILPYYAAGGIMAFVYRAWNQVRFPALGTIIIGIINVTVLIVICKLFHPSDPIVVLAISAVFSFMQCFILNATTVGKLYPEIKKVFRIIFYRITIVYLVSYLCSRLYVSFVQISNILMLAISLVAIGAILLAIVYFLVFDKSEKKRFVAILR